MYTTGFGFTNTTDGVKTVQTYALSEKTNYALIEDEAGVSMISNLTSPVDQAEKMSIKAQTLNKVSTSNPSILQNPTGYEGGIQFSLKDEMLYRVASTDGATAQDFPVVVTLTVKHGRNAAVTDTVVETAIKRVISMLYKNDGTSRIASLQRLATKADED